MLVIGNVIAPFDLCIYLVDGPLSSQLAFGPLISTGDLRPRWRLEGRTLFLQWLMLSQVGAL